MDATVFSCKGKPKLGTHRNQGNNKTTYLVQGGKQVKGHTVK